ILAQAVPDRAPLTDPSGEASLALLLAQPIPVRTTPAPFVRLSVPDPFANHQVLAWPPEDGLPASGAMGRTPAKKPAEDADGADPRGSAPSASSAVYYSAPSHRNSA